MHLRATTNILRRFLSIWLLATASVVSPQGTLEVITLRHRTAEQVIPVLQPLLAPGGALSGQYNQLIVRSTPENLAQIRSVLDAIDKPARRLVISVRFDNAQNTERSAIQGEARVSNGGSSVAVGVRDSRSASEGRVDQRVQVLEGGQARIATGEARNYSETAIGMIVVPRLAGDRVTLDILAQQEAYAQGGAVRGQQASSVASGRLGEWIELGGVSSSSVQSATGSSSWRGGAVSSDRGIWVMVEELR